MRRRGETLRRPRQPVVYSVTAVGTGTADVCPTGKVAVGGGFDAVGFPGQSVYGSFPTDVNGTG